MRTAIRDVAEGMDMGLETGSVPGLSCSLYGGVDFEEDDREVTGWSAVGKEAIPADVDMGKTTRTCNAEGAGEPSPQPEPLFMPYPRHEKGLLDNSFPFSLSHMHYVGRSFRLLNQFSRPSPAHSERFSGRKFHRTEIFCRKPEGKRADPRGRRNFDEEGEKSLVP